MTASTRPIAGDVGTTDRIECESGHYWVRLWSRQAIRREGEAMVNCLRRGAYDHLAGSDDPRSRSLWSLRETNGASTALADVAGAETNKHLVKTFLGAANNMASPLAYRQLRHLTALYAGLGSDLYFSPEIAEPAICAPDGMTYRWDHAPKDLRLPDHDMRLEARKLEQEARQRRNERARRNAEGGPPVPEGIPPGGAYFIRADPARMAAIGGFEINLDDWDYDAAEGNRIGEVRRRYDPMRTAEVATIIGELPPAQHDALTDEAGTFSLLVMQDAQGGFEIRVNRRVFHVSERFIERSGFEAAVRTILEREALLPEFIEIRSNEVLGNPLVWRARDSTWLPPLSELDVLHQVVESGVVSPSSAHQRVADRIAESIRRLPGIANVAVRP